MKFENFKKLRKNKGLTQKELCGELKKLGCDLAQNTYSQYETGKRLMPAEVLIKLTLFYETSADYILGLKDEQ